MVADFGGFPLLTENFLFYIINARKEAFSEFDEAGKKISGKKI